jgi:hypothetical protein
MSVIEKARPGGAARPPRRGGRGRRTALALVLLALAAAGATLWWSRACESVLEPAPAPVTQPPPEPPPLGATEPPPLEPEAAPVVEPPPAPAEPRVTLAESDALARELAGAVSRSPLLAPALRGSGLVERFVAIVDQLAEGNAPRRELAALRPQGAFLVLGREPELRIDPGSYHRYDALAQAIAGIDARAAVAAYRRLAALCEESYRELGYPEGGFEQRLRTALALLGSTPQIDPSPALVAQVKRYEFADPDLESLSDAQKQLLRMGPKNAALVATKVRELEAALGPVAR